MALGCGATKQQNQIESSQQNFMNQLQQQAGAVFGNASTVFNNLMSTFQPTVAAGPNQQGFSPAELSNLNSQAITQTGQAYQNAKAAVGNQMSAEGGGNTSLPSGAQIGENVQLAESGANQTANELAGITQENYAVGRQNYENAVRGEMAVPGVFGTATGAADAATGAGSSASATANQIAQQQSSWMQPVIGALGGVAGAFTGGLTNTLFKGGSNKSASTVSGLNTPSVINANPGPAPGFDPYSSGWSNSVNPPGTSGVPGY